MISVSFVRNKPRSQKTKVKRKKSRTVLENYRIKEFHTYVPYNDLKHYKKDEFNGNSKLYGQTDGWTNGRADHGLIDRRTDGWMDRESNM